MQPTSPGREAGLVDERCDGLPTISLPPKGTLLEGCTPKTVPIAGIVLTGISTAPACGDGYDILASLTWEETQRFGTGVK